MAVQQDVKTFCYNSSMLIMRGLHQEIKLFPNRDYVPAVHQSARVFNLRLQNINPHYLGTIKKMQEELSMWAGLEDEHQQVRVSRKGHNIFIEIPKPMPYWNQITIEQMKQRRMFRQGHIATLGMGLEDEPKRIDFSDISTAHIFVCGQIRSGKTNTEHLIAWNLIMNSTPDKSQMIIFDVAKKGANWRIFNSVSHLIHPVIILEDVALAVLKWIAKQVEVRAMSPNIAAFPKLFVFIDELSTLIEDVEEAAPYLERIATLGPEFGIHLVLATQYPQIKMLQSAQLKRNITTRLCGKVDDADAAKNAMGAPDTGAETLGGYGDFLLKDSYGVSRFTVAHVRQKNLGQMPRTSEMRRISELDLNNIEITNAPPQPKPQPQVKPVRSSHQPSPIKPSEIALALFENPGIGKLKKQLNTGTKRAQRIKRFADGIRAWARNNEVKCLPE